MLCRVALGTQIASHRESRGRFQMVNRGEEKVRVHMNVVPRSSGNTNSGNRLCGTWVKSNYSGTPLIRSLMYKAWLLLLQWAMKIRPYINSGWPPA